MKTTSTDWRPRAACRGQDPEIFYPTSGEPRRDAIIICHKCPVRTECLNEAIDFGDNHGIWGGTTPNERKNLVRRAIRSGKPSPVHRRRQR